MKGEYWLLTFIAFCVILVLCVGCDNMNCEPNVRLENKKGDWFAGFKCGGKW